jgi:hypothetical protein
MAANVTGLNVSPYLTSALSRIQANDMATKPGTNSPAPSPSGGGSTEASPQLLSNQTLGALVAIRSENNSGC